MQHACFQAQKVSCDYRNIMTVIINQLTASLVAFQKKYEINWITVAALKSDRSGSQRACVFLPMRLTSERVHVVFKSN